MNSRNPPIRSSNINQHSHGRVRVVKAVGPSIGSVMLLVGSRAEQLGSVGQDYLEKLWEQAREVRYRARSEHKMHGAYDENCCSGFRSSLSSCLPASSTRKNSSAH